MTAVEFTLADVQAIERTLRLMNKLDDAFGSSLHRDEAYDRLDALSGRMLGVLDDEPLPELAGLLADTLDHSKHADLRVVRGGRCV